MNALLRKIKSAVKDRATESAQRKAVAQVLAEAGNVTLPEISTARDSHGGTVRFYVFQGTPAGDFALITGPSIEPQVHTLDELDAMDAPGTFSVFAVPASSDVAKKAAQDFQRTAKAEGVSTRKSKPKPTPRTQEFVPVPRPGSAASGRRFRAQDQDGGEFEPLVDRMKYGPPSAATIAGTRARGRRADSGEGAIYEPLTKKAAPVADDDAMMKQMMKMLDAMKGDIIASLRK